MRKLNEKFKFTDADINQLRRFLSKTASMYLRPAFRLTPAETRPTFAFLALR